MRPDLTYIRRLCDEPNVPYATNLATAEMLVQGLAWAIWTGGKSPIPDPSGTRCKKPRPSPRLFFCTTGYPQ